MERPASSGAVRGIDGEGDAEVEAGFVQFDALGPETWSVLPGHGRQFPGIAVHFSSAKVAGSTVSRTLKSVTCSTRKVSPSRFTAIFVAF